MIDECGENVNATALIVDLLGNWVMVDGHGGGALVVYWWNKPGRPQRPTGPKVGWKKKCVSSRNMEMGELEMGKRK